MRRRFEFRLQRLARVRDIEERLAREERVAAEGRARAATDECDRARRELAESRQQLALHISSTVDPRRVLSVHRLIDDQQRLLRERVGQAAQERRLAETAAEAHRNRRSDSLAMGKLREQALVRHRQALDKEENAQMDEVASQRSARRVAPRAATPLLETPRPPDWRPETPSRNASVSADQGSNQSPDRSP